MNQKQTLILSATIGISSFTWLLFQDWKIALGVMGLCTANNLLKFIAK